MKQIEVQAGLDQLESNWNYFVKSAKKNRKQTKCSTMPTVTNSLGMKRQSSTAEMCRDYGRSDQRRTFVRGCPVGRRSAVVQHNDEALSAHRLFRQRR